MHADGENIFDELKNQWGWERHDHLVDRGRADLKVALHIGLCRRFKVTERRAAEDYAQCMRELVDVHCPDAECIRVVQDNLSTRPRLMLCKGNGERFHGMRELDSIETVKLS